jgi:hypothetical protein
MRYLLTILTFFIFSSPLGTQAKSPVVAIGWPSPDESNREALAATTEYLGVSQNQFDCLGGIPSNLSAGNIVTIMSESCLELMGDSHLQSLTNDIRKKKVSALIFYGDVNLSKRQERIFPVMAYKQNLSEGTLCFSGKHPSILRELGGLGIPVRINGKAHFLKRTKIPQKYETEPLIWLEDKNGGKHELIVIAKGLNLVFAAVHNFEIQNGDNTFRNFPIVFPYVFFLRNIFGERVWHRNTIQANFTIDDPWLIEPYGNLSFKGLLNEMEKANFHTTIAFVPWNYDRSRKEVVQLFLEHQKRFSIISHGNNHDHYEFEEYSKVPIEEHEHNIRQARTRMEQFKKITGIQYGNVMVFPHNISPEKTLNLLKLYGFNASFNSKIVPLGIDKSPDFNDMLWPATLKYHGFPILQRFNPAFSDDLTKILLFLQKPILYYVHQDFFYGNIGAFNKVASGVNSIGRNRVDWISLEDISQSLYMERQNELDMIEIRMLAPSVVIKNTTGKEHRYRIIETLTGGNNISFLKIGETIYKDNFEKELLRPRVLKAGGDLKVVIAYGDTKNGLNESFERGGIRVYLLRMLCDVRDLYFSKSKIGRKFIALITDLFPGK